ncbi:T-complex protein 1 subunit alpha [Dirofilaria immitis]
MIYHNVLLFICYWILINGQPLPILPGIDLGVLTNQARRFLDLYGVATQLMNLGGTIIDNAKTVYDSTGPDSFGSSGNSVSGDFARPWYNSDRRNTKNKYDSLLFNEYRNGAYGNDYGSTIKNNGIETLLNTFLGPSFFTKTTSSPAINLADFFKPAHQQSDNDRIKGGSDINRLVDKLVRSGAQRATPNPDISPNLLQTIFGK